MGLLSGEERTELEWRREKTDTRLLKDTGLIYDRFGIIEGE